MLPSKPNGHPLFASGRRAISKFAGSNRHSGTRTEKLPAATAPPPALSFPHSLFESVPPRRPTCLAFDSGTVFCSSTAIRCSPSVPDPGRNARFESPRTYCQECVLASRAHLLRRERQLGNPVVTVFFLVVRSLKRNPLPASPRHFGRQTPNSSGWFAPMMPGHPRSAAANRFVNSDHDPGSLTWSSATVKPSVPPHRPAHQDIKKFLGSPSCRESLSGCPISGSDCHDKTRGQHVVNTRLRASIR